MDAYIGNWGSVSRSLDQFLVSMAAPVCNQSPAKRHHRVDRCDQQTFELEAFDVWLGFFLRVQNDERLFPLRLDFQPAMNQSTQALALQRPQAAGRPLFGVCIMRRQGYVHGLFNGLLAVWRREHLQLIRRLDRLPKMAQGLVEKGSTLTRIQALSSGSSNLPAPSRYIDNRPRRDRWPGHATLRFLL